MAPELVEGVTPELVEGVTPELVEGVTPELVEGARKCKAKPPTLPLRNLADAATC
ncbi:MAG: hypothetical protein AB1428_00435 [Bacteroidota bacterium]